MFGIGNRSIVRVVFILLASSLLGLTVSALAACGNRNETQTAAPVASSDAAPAARVTEPNGEASVEVTGASSDAAPAAQVADSDGEASVEATGASEVSPAAQVVDSDGEALIEAAQPSGVEAMLSGDTLTRYRALPPAYQQALELYAYVGVSDELIPAVVQDKIDQWGNHAIPLAELVGDARVRRIESRVNTYDFTTYPSLLAGYYVFLLNTEPDADRRADAMGKLVDVIVPPSPPNTVGLDVDESTDPNPPLPPMLDWPDVETFLTPTALSRLDGFPPRLRERLKEPLAVHFTDQTFPNSLKDVARFMLMYEVLPLNVQPPSDLPAMEDVLSSDDLLVFQSLPAADREHADYLFEVILIHSYLSATFQPGWADASAWEEVWTEEYAAKNAADQLKFAVDWSEIKQTSAGPSM